MSIRNVSLAVSVCLAASTAAIGQNNQGVGYVIQLPGVSSSGGQIFPYIETSNPFNPITSSAVGPAGTFEVIATPSGSKFYLLGTSGANGLQDVDPTFTHFNSVNGLGAAPTAAVMTPDGKYLLVGADGLYIIDTTDDVILTSPPLQLPTNPSACAGCGAVGIAVSKDSTLAYVLTNSSFGSTITAYNIPARQRVSNLQSLNITGGATSIAMSPLGLLYVATVNRLYEVNPATLTVTANGQFALVATPGPLHFTPDGTRALFVNTTPNVGGQALLELNIATLSVSSWPPPPYNPSSPPPDFNDVYVVSNSRAFAFSSASNTLWDVTVAPLNAVVSTLSTIFQTIGSPLAVANSNEFPNSRYLFILSANGSQYYLNRIDLSTNTLSLSTAAASSTGILQVVNIPNQTSASAANFIQFNNNQLVSAGGTSNPLIARVLDANGVPVFNLPVTFSTDSVSAAAGLIINTPTPTTNADGYVQTTASMPPTPGTYTITLTAGLATTTFTVTVPGGSTGGTGPGGGTTSQVSIASGDGQLIAESFNTGLLATANPLTIYVTDANGNPLPNVTVAFSVTSGPGAVINSSTSTNANGYASTNFIAGTVQQGLAFQTSTVNAITQYGQVNFTITTVHINQDSTGQPQVRLLVPDNSFTITAAQGTPMPNAIVAQIFSGNFPEIGTPIPGVGISLASPFTTTLMPGPASSGYVAPGATCQGSTLSDSTGTASCTLVAACQAGTTQELDIYVGGSTFRTTLHITSGTPTKISKVSGDNQSGSAGQTLAQNLVATITDGCGSPISGVQVNWTVVSGSATLSSTVSTSDSQGHVSTKVALGQAAGAVQVRVAIGNTVQATFQLTNQVVVTGITLTSGNNQTVTTGQTYPLPLTFTVHDSGGNPVPGVLVTFTVTSGSATTNPVSATTGTTGTASTTVSATTPAGNIVITAATGFTATATLVSQSPGPSITASFTNAASSGVAGLVPCGLGTLTGNGIAPNIQNVLTPFNAFGPPLLSLRWFRNECERSARAYTCHFEPKWIATGEFPDAVRNRARNRHCGCHGEWRQHYPDRSSSPASSAWYLYLLWREQPDLRRGDQRHGWQLCNA